VRAFWFDRTAAGAKDFMRDAAIPFDGHPIPGLLQFVISLPKRYNDPACPLEARQRILEKCR
jgi:hypothetical protein